MPEHKKSCTSRPVEYVCKICNAAFNGSYNILDYNFSKHIFQEHKTSVIYLPETKDWSFYINFEDKAKIVIKYSRKYFRNEYYWVSQIIKCGRRQIVVQLFFANDDICTLEKYEITSHTSELIFQGKVLKREKTSSDILLNSHDVSKLCTKDGPVKIKFFGLKPIPSEITSLLECMICKYLMTDKIINCSTGHSLCMECSDKMKVCPLCKKPILGQRNFLAESLVSAMDSYCRYIIYGCEEILTPETRSAHMQCCSFAQINCYKCSLKVNYNHLYKHLFDECKARASVYKSDSIIDLSSCRDVMIFTSFGKHFILHFLKTAETFTSMAVRQISCSSSVRFYFQVKLYNTSNCKYKQTTIVDQCELMNKLYPIQLSGFTHIKVSVFILPEDISI